MSAKYVCLLFLTISVYHGFAEKSEYLTTSEVDKKGHTEDGLLGSIVRARNSSKVLHLKNNVHEEQNKSNEKKARTVLHGSQESDVRDNCCGSRYNSASATRPDTYQDRIPTEGGRYPSQYNERLPIDRYSWQAQGRPPGSSGSNGRPYPGNFVGIYGGSTIYGGTHFADRYGTRPGHGSSSTGRPAGYGSGPEGYGYGNNHFEGYEQGKPGGYVGSYGISGTLADGSDFGPVEGGFPEGGPPPSSNIHTQKAVALKALAGVALIGAAAALAANPVLLPLGIVAGRKKRSIFSTEDEDVRVNYLLNILKNNVSKTYRAGTGKKLVVSPGCAAKLTCEIQKNYLSDLKSNVEITHDYRHPQDRLSDIIQSNVFSVESENLNLKKLIKMGMAVASNGRSCNIFKCSSIKIA